jgi:peptidoglycan/xylan/chitin deacetylase (PgdA/CDA1 family)
LKKTLLKTIYNLGGFAPFHWAMREKALVLTYHRFSTDREPHKISRAEFARHLEYLSKHNRVLSLSEIAERLRNRESLPANAVAITIDDGYRDAYEVAFPVLEEFGFAATLFAVTDFLDRKCWLWTDLMRFVLSRTKSETIAIEFGNDDRVEARLGGEIDRLETAGRLNARLKRLPDRRKKEKIEAVAAALKVEIPPLPPAEFAPLSWDEAREMDGGRLKIESHTVTHPILTQIEQPELDFELQASKSRLEAALDKRIEHFCYPNGTLDETVRKAVERAGYESAVTTEYGFNDERAEPFLLKRIDASPAIENFAQSVSGFESLKQKIRV